MGAVGGAAEREALQQLACACSRTGAATWFALGNMNAEQRASERDAAVLVGRALHCGLSAGKGLRCNARLACRTHASGAPAARTFRCSRLVDATGFYNEGDGREWVLQHAGSL